MNDEAAPVEETIGEPIFTNPDAGEWFIVHVLSGHEMKVRNCILKTMGIEGGYQEFIHDIFIAQEEVTEVRQGKKTTRNKKFFPGYLLIRMDLFSKGVINADVWHFINGVAGVIGFLGGEQALPLTKAEVKDIMDQVRGTETATKPRINFEIGETVAIKDGAFANFEGVVETIDADRGKVKLLVNIFGRSTPIELEYWQIERQ